MARILNFEKCVCADEHVGIGGMENRLKAEIIWKCHVLRGRLPHHTYDINDAAATAFRERVSAFCGDLNIGELSHTGRQIWSHSSADVTTAIVTVVKIDRLRATGDPSPIAPLSLTTNLPTPHHLSFQSITRKSDVALADIFWRLIHDHHR